MELLTPREAGEYLTISTNTLATWRSKKKGPKFVKTGKSVKYTMADLRRGR